MLRSKAVLPFPAELKPPRRPLLWAAFAYGAGIVAGAHAWRPPLWWVVAALGFIGAGAYFRRHRVWLGFALVLGSLFFVGALGIQMRYSGKAPDGGIDAFADGNEATVTAHVTRQGEVRPSALGGWRESIDLQTESVGAGEAASPIHVGLRLGIYTKESDAPYNGDDQGAPMRGFRYGERLRFPVKLRVPRNFRNPGAFDYRGYLADNGIVALGSAKASAVAVLPGLVGTRMGAWRDGIHHSVVRKIHTLWPAEDAALMDAAVIGEGAFLTPLTELLMPAAVLAVAVGYVSASVAKVPAWFAAMALHGITGTVRGLGGFRIADHRVAMPDAGTVAVAFAGLVVAMVLVLRRRWLAMAGLAALAGAGLWVSATEPHPQVRSAVMEVTAIDVGQGDSIFVVSPGGKTLLVDAGGPVGGQQTEFDYGENVVSAYLWERGISRLDAVAITHGYSDHIGGMHAILSNFQPRELWIGALPSTRAIDAVLDHARRLGVRIVRRNDGDAFEFGGMHAEVFSPPAAWVTSTQPRNNDSLVLRLRFRESVALLEGDAERVVEERMVASHDLHADLLKVGHHGSNTSSTLELLNAVHPRWAIISVGLRNTFGHPRIETLEHLQGLGTATYRTDRNGAVTFYLDGQTVNPQLASLR